MDERLSTGEIQLGGKRGSRIKYNSKKRLSRVVVLLVCILYSVFLFIPFYAILVTSITPLVEYGSSNSFVWFPKAPTFEAYKNILFDDPMIYTTGMSSIVVGFLNTLWIVTIPCVISIFVSGMSAYAYAKIDFKGKNGLFMLQLATMMIPSATLTIPSYVFYNAIGWGQGFWALFIPRMFGSTVMIFFLRSYMTSVPNEILEAAKMDGLSTFGIFWKIMVPLCVPAFVAQFIFAFVGGYNDYAGPLLYLYGNPNSYTLQLALSNIQEKFSNPNQQCAAAVIAIIPLTIFYIIFKKFFIEGIAVGGGKE